MVLGCVFGWFPTCPREGGKGVGSGTEVGVRRDPLSLQAPKLLFPSTVLPRCSSAPSCAEACKHLRKVSETGTALGGDSWAGKWDHRSGVIRDGLIGLLMVIPAEKSFRDSCRMSEAERLGLRALSQFSPFSLPAESGWRMFGAAASAGGLLR